MHFNENIIDHNQFPPHVSLHICTMPRGSAQELEARLRSGNGIDLFPLLKLAGVKKGGSGYVNLAVERTPSLMALHEFVLELAVEARHSMEGDIRPHVRQVSHRGQSRYEKYGNAYVLDAFEPHFSIAKVDRQDQDDAYEVAVDILDEVKVSRISALELCEIGLNNEVWNPILTIHQCPS